MAVGCQLMVFKFIIIRCSFLVYVLSLLSCNQLLSGSGLCSSVVFNQNNYFTLHDDIAVEFYAVYIELNCRFLVKLTLLQICKIKDSVDDRFKLNCYFKIVVWCCFWLWRRRGRTRSRFSRRSSFSGCSRFSVLARRNYY